MDKEDEEREVEETKLNLTTDYAVRIMQYLYKCRGQLVTEDELSKSLGIPHNYVPRVIRRLKQANLVVSERGQFGGCRIVEPCEEISLYDIFHVTEPEPLIRCLEEGHSCSGNVYGHCSVGTFYRLMQEKRDDYLRRITLKILSENPDEERLLEIMG